MRTIVTIKVLDARFTKYVETCLQMIGSGSYQHEGDTFRLNCSAHHAHMPEQIITDVMTREKHDHTKIVSFTYSDMHAEYVRLTKKLLDAFDKEWTNVFEEEKYINDIKSEISKTFKAQYAYDIERERENEHTAYARILNIFGEDRAKEVTRKF